MIGAVCVFCGSSPGDRPVFADAARALGTTLAHRGIRLVYGGGNVGLMGVVADAALAAGGEVVGVIPEALFAKEVAHGGLTKLHRVQSMHERKTLMYDLSDGFIALPGGIGTLEEIFEILTWGQLGLHQKPCGFLNVEGYFDPLLAFMDEMVSRRFVKEKHRALVMTSPDVDGLLERFERFHPPRLDKWIEPGET
ncbi:MAG TPA: TIGR00730 family Rossman fold protein [bacterium]|nr:TIGR00730 family Rossman fold protein [bacterium]